MRPHPSLIGKWVIRRNHISKGVGPHPVTAPDPGEGREVTVRPEVCPTSLEPPPGATVSLPMTILSELLVRRPQPPGELGG